MREKAVALQYQDIDDLPRVVASGAGEVARQILEIAEHFGVPVQQDQVLAEMLSKLNAGAVISPESYRLVAEVICFLYYADQQWAKQHPGLAQVLPENPVGGKLLP